MRRLSVWLVLLVCCGACGQQTVEGALVVSDLARNRVLKRRISVPVAAFEQPVDIVFYESSENCKLTLNAQRDAPDAPDRCDALGGEGVFRCDHRHELPFVWTLTSCHSGLGRSRVAGGPAVAFGFGSNYVSAMNQLDGVMSSADAWSIELRRPQ